MFRWRKEIERLDIEARRVHRLHRSLGDVQVALAGLPSQEATAYLCAFAVEGGYQVAVALHLLKSDRMAFYFSGDKKVDREQVGSAMEEGARFAESMGFMMGETDIHLLAGPERESLWNALPLRRGRSSDASGHRTVPPDEGPSREESGAVAGAAAFEESDEPIEELVEEAEELVEEAEELVEEAEELAQTRSSAFGDGDISPAVDRMQGRQRPPTREEMERRRRILREHLGRFLASF